MLIICKCINKMVKNNKRLIMLIMNNNMKIDK